MRQEPTVLHEFGFRGATLSRGVERALPYLSGITMAMTLPQVWTIWIDGNAAGVSLASWATYLVAASLWFVHGLYKRDKTIYLACVGWILLDAAVVVGVLVRA
jgi:uncharacterized protein with PQ loop repeat